jgi:hypothetical protein
MTRPVILVALTGRTVTLRPVRDCTVADVVDLVQRAGVPDSRRGRAAVIVGASRLPDVEALARTVGVVVVRTKSSRNDGEVVPASSAPPPTPAVAGVHGCAGSVCRVPGCRAGAA